MPNSRWKIRDPSRFPAEFMLATLTAAECPGHAYTFHSTKTKIEARKYCDKFREWRFCLRNWGNRSHPIYPIERDNDIKLSTVFDPVLSLWRISIIIRPKRNIALLNPHLAELIDGST